MSVMCANQKQKDRNNHQKLFGRRILISIVDLLPQIQIVVRARIELKRYSAYPMEHDVWSKHVRDICEGPGSLLGGPWDDVVEYLEADNDDEVDTPCAYETKLISREFTRRCQMEGRAA